MDNDGGLFLDRLYANTFYSGKPTLQALDETLLEFTKSKSPFARAFMKISKRMHLGEYAASAFREEIKTMRIKDRALKSKMIELCNGNDIKSIIENICKEFSYSERIKLEKGFGSLQKYLAVAMLASTILPSLALFGFVGYSILYGSQQIFIVFSSLLLLVFPGLFMIAKRRISGIYGQE